MIQMDNSIDVTRDEIRARLVGNFGESCGQALDRVLSALAACEQGVATSCALNFASGPNSILITDPKGLLAAEHLMNTHTQLSTGPQVNFSNVGRLGQILAVFRV